MNLLVFPLFLSFVGLAAVLMVLSRHGAFIERYRSERAQAGAVEVAKLAARRVQDFPRVVLIAVVRHEETLLIGYKKADEFSGVREDKRPEIDHPELGETMIAWLPSDDELLTSTLDSWCATRAELYMKIDTNSRVVRLSNMDLESTVELTLTPTSSR
ncbi:hypothetical protein SAMN02745225_00962 [Ferrithrix thermotolerans DSM 19514]|jgi:hypothetical protein|uniref:Uncharacterized protein n=1 Tax=Ferrithrix thermotolerans DSM 19514 TaxID=1121881 RepID=A0A1M4UGS4_9ACTN|nr:hypothetical protein [Ferrithrix thermotolerans]SHE55760.1 hypothetical protein SAMN02745225_00962 [Ferrithrix thermotolerans DSM 19514]